MADAFFTRAPSTIVTIPLTGQLEFTIPFEFLARKFVVVTLLGTDRKVLTMNTDYRFIAVNKIRLERAPDGDYTRIELRRVTSATDRLVTFIDGSILRATDLNLSQVQTMHVAEEARDMTSDNIGVNDDGDLDARNRKIVNLADAENDLDAVNLGQLKQFDTSTGNNADKAARSAEAAKLSETNAANSEDRCVVAEAKAISSAGTAMTAAADANRSKVAAKQSEDASSKILEDVIAASGPSTELVARVDKVERDTAAATQAVNTLSQTVNTLSQTVNTLSQDVGLIAKAVGYNKKTNIGDLITPSSGWSFGDCVVQETAQGYVVKLTMLGTNGNTSNRVLGTLKPVVRFVGITGATVSASQSGLLSSDYIQLANGNQLQIGGSIGPFAWLTAIITLEKI